MASNAKKDLDWGEVTGSCLEIIAYLLLIIIFVPVMRGYILSTMWNWFMVTGLHTPPLNVGYAIGVSFVISLFTINVSESQKTSKDDKRWEALANAVPKLNIKETKSMAEAWQTLCINFFSYVGIWGAGALLHFLLH